MTTDTWGDDSSAVANQNGYVLWNVTCVATANGTLQTIGLSLHAAAGNLRLAIYDSSDNLLGESASTAAIVGFNDLAIPGSVPIVLGNTYRLAFQVDDAGASVHYLTGQPSGTSKYSAQGYGAFPATLPTGTNWGGQFYMRMTYAPAITKNQELVRWYTNDNAESPTALAAENTTITDVADATVLRLRLSVKVTLGTYTAKTFKLQYQAGGYAGAWTDVGAAGGAAILRYYNGLGTDQAVIANLLLSSSTVKEHFAESAPSATMVDIPVNGIGEWDLCLQANGVAGGTSYYFRIVENDGTTLDSYTNYAVFTTAPTYTDYGTILYYDETKFTNPTIYFEALIKTSGAAFTAYARLYNVTDTAVVASSTVSTVSTSYSRQRSSALTLTTGKEYKAQVGGISGGTTSIKGARLIVQV